MSNITVPNLGEGIEKATVSAWYFKVGDRINEGDDLVELVTDKATFNVPSPSGGVIKTINAKENQEVKIGEVLATIE